MDVKAVSKYKKTNSRRTGLLPKHKRKKKSNNKPIFAGSVFLVAVFILSAFGFLTIKDPPSPYAFNKNLTLTGTIANGFVLDDLAFEEDTTLVIIISELTLHSGFDLRITFSGVDTWMKTTSTSNIYRIPITQTSIYSLKFSVDSVYVSGKITCNVKLMVE